VWAKRRVKFGKKKSERPYIVHVRLAAHGDSVREPDFGAYKNYHEQHALSRAHARAYSLSLSLSKGF